MLKESWAISGMRRLLTTKTLHVTAALLYHKEFDLWFTFIRMDDRRTFVIGL